MRSTFTTLLICLALSQGFSQKDLSSVKWIISQERNGRFLAYEKIDTLQMELNMETLEEIPVLGPGGVQAILDLDTNLLWSTQGTNYDVRWWDEEFITVFRHERMGVIDYDGHTILNFDFYDHIEHGNNIFLTYDHDTREYRFLNELGEDVIPETFSVAFPMYQNQTLVQKQNDGPVFQMNIEGEKKQLDVGPLVDKIRITEMAVYSCRGCNKGEDSFGLIMKNGTKLTEPIFSSVQQVDGIYVGSVIETSSDAALRSYLKD